jgi:hypothetical protein
MIGLDGNTEAGGSRRNGWGADGGDEVAGVVEFVGDFECLGRITQNDRDDLAGAAADIESHVGEAVS